MGQDGTKVGRYSKNSQKMGRPLWTFPTLTVTIDMDFLLMELGHLEKLRVSAECSVSVIYGTCGNVNLIG